MKNRKPRSRRTEKQYQLWKYIPRFAIAILNMVGLIAKVLDWLHDHDFRK